MGLSSTPFTNQRVHNGWLVTRARSNKSLGGKTSLSCYFESIHTTRSTTVDGQKWFCWYFIKFIEDSNINYWPTQPFGLFLSIRMDVELLLFRKMANEMDFSFWCTPVHTCVCLTNQGGLPLLPSDNTRPPVMTDQPFRSQALSDCLGVATDPSRYE